MELNLLSNPGATGALGLVADWTHTLNSDEEFTGVLSRLAHLVKAETALVIRTSKTEKRPQYIGRFNRQKGKVWPTELRSFSAIVLGEFMWSAKAGSIWTLADCAPSHLANSPAASSRIQTPPKEVVISPLEITAGHVDHIELQFTHMPAEHDLNLFIMLIGTLVSSWGRRTPAAISKRLTRSRRPKLATANAAPQVNILDAENPAQLSRSEFRICSLLKEGMTVSTISHTLSVRPATVRSHLSSIFSKTDVSGQVELLHELNRPFPIPVVPHATNAHLTGT